VTASNKANHIRKESQERNFDPGRRKFGQWALAGALGGAALTSRPLTGAPMLHDLPPGIKIAVQLGADPSDEDLQFVNQLGVDYVSIWLHADGATYENFMRLRRKIEGVGLKV
jgi:mannonate dehydratase